MENDLDKIAEAILKEKYLEKTSWLSEDELAQVLKLIVEKSGKDGWRLVQHENVDEDKTWFELELSDGWDESFFEMLEWLNYTR